MKTLRIIALIIFIATTVIVAFGIWYNNEYSMEVISAQEINTPKMEKSLLIASQGSDYKNQIVDRLIDHYKNEQVYIKIIDVTQLQNVIANDFTAIVILHTWEIGNPPDQVATFVSSNISLLHKTIVVSTSGDGISKIEGIDALTGESITTNVPKRVKEILTKLNEFL